MVCWDSFHDKVVYIDPKPYTLSPNSTRMLVYMEPLGSGVIAGYFVGFVAGGRVSGSRLNQFSHQPQALQNLNPEAT